MPEKTLYRAAMLMVILVVIAIGSWEGYLRHTAAHLGYDDDKELWANKRARIYDAPEKTTVFIGSSRIKFDLDIPTWEKITGREAVQLSVQGSSPIPILLDLGNDSNFSGKLVIDVTEPLFFNNDPMGVQRPDRYVAYYKRRTPAQRAGFVLNHLLESQFLFLDQERYSLNAEIDKWKLPNRPGVYVFPDFPDDFGVTTFDRQSTMTPRFMADSSLRHQVQQVWVFLMNMGRNAPPPKEDPVPIILASVQNAVSKIRARGGEVFFIRTPSSGPFLMGEQHAFPRGKIWDPLLTTTHSKGFYYADDPATAHFTCPEWSHLSPSDAILYTKVLITRLPPSFVQPPSAAQTSSLVTPGDCLTKN
jgi:hypothetical protein